MYGAMPERVACNGHGDLGRRSAAAMFFTIYSRLVPGRSVTAASYRASIDAPLQGLSNGVLRVSFYCVAHKLWGCKAAGTSPGMAW